MFVPGFSDSTRKLHFTETGRTVHIKQTVRQPPFLWIFLIIRQFVVGGLSSQYDSFTGAHLINKLRHGNCLFDCDFSFHDESLNVRWDVGKEEDCVFMSLRKEKECGASI